MKVSFVFDWKFVLAGCAGTALIIAVSKMDTEGLEKTATKAAEVIAQKYAICDHHE